MTRARRALALVLLLCGAACGGYTTIDEHPCPPGGTTLTYDDFGRGFLASYCQTCHGAPLAARRGAPPEVDFATADAARAYKDRIFARAAGDNTSMPPGPDDPPKAERDALADWLACGAP